MHVEIIPCLKDNYAYLLTCPETHQRAVVDPSEAEPVLQALKGQKLDMILNTHHHWDHVGGNEALIKRFPELKIYGHSSDSARISGQNIYLEDGETFLLG